MNVLSVAVGSAIGGVCRYLVGLALPTLLCQGYGGQTAGGFPWATLCVNVLGSLVLGAVSGVLSSHGGSAALRAFVIVGFCGGFTTFSTFSNESLRMIESSQWGMLAIYMTLSLIAGIAAVWIGVVVLGHG